MKYAYFSFCPCHERSGQCQGWRYNFEIQFQVELTDHGWHAADEREREGDESDEEYEEHAPTHGWWCLSQSLITNQYFIISSSCYLFDVPNYIIYSFRNKVDAKVLLELFDIFIWDLIFGKILWSKYIRCSESIIAFIYSLNIQYTINRSS